MNDPIFRKAKKEDVPYIVQMLAADALGQTREKYTNPLPQSYYDAFDRINRDENQHLTIVEKNKEVIGVFQLTFIPYLTYQGSLRAQIEGVRIRADFRGKGLGEKMFRWAIEKSKEEGAHLLQLTTDKKRPDALRFYEKLEFIASHEGMKLHFNR